MKPAHAISGCGVVPEVRRIKARKARPLKSRFWSWEEFANSLTHGFGLLLSLCGAPILVALAARKGNGWHVLSCSIYGASAIILYTASTLYHALPRPDWKRLLRLCDHAAIYLMIAGTYTPFLLITLQGRLGWLLFGLLWGLALAGIVFKVFFLGRFKILSTLGYLGMGWLAVIVIKPLLAHLPFAGFMWILAGGLAYSFGLIFYAWKRLPYHHAIWHLFVLAGSVCHYFAVLFYVLP